MADHAQPVSKSQRRLFIQALEAPSPAVCKDAVLPPIFATTLALGEECYKGV